MSEPKRYRKKPAIIDAAVFSGLMTIDEAFALADWCGGEFNFDNKPGQHHKNYYWSITIPTLEGYMRAAVGDYIIRGVQGEFYPCKPDIFSATYEEVAP